MKLSTRYALIAMGALGLLSIIHWIRDQRLTLSPTADFLVGVGPNFAAAIAITFVLISIQADRNAAQKRAVLQRWFSGCSAIAGIGLIGWELIQQSNANFVFDGSDFAATIVGLGIGFLVFRAVTPATAAPT